ncbi:MAG: NTP transferase domain-containing protein [Gemmatimonadetes bacterium]|nr:NTP transferase domain-containing protein [Gemmatimonadota bacterium]
MRAVILAAGRGTRLRAVHEPPKCLLPIGGVTLLERYLTTFDALGVATTVVAGYRADAVRACVRAAAPRAPRAPCDVLVNDEYELGSIVSLAVGLRAVDDALLLLDGDVFFHPALLQRLVRSPHPNVLLVDIGSSFTGEEYMAGLDAGRVRTLRRALVSGHEETGEWVGFARLAADATARLRAAVDRQVAAGATSGGYEDALASLLPDVHVRAVPTDGLPWVEIDFPEDVARAEALARAAIT